MPRLQTDGLMLEEGIWIGPKNTNYVDMIMVSDGLREQPTTRNNRYWTMQPFDFPTLYGVDEPVRYMTFDPVSTYAVDQSRSFAQRYGRTKQ